MHRVGRNDIKNISCHESSSQKKEWTFDKCQGKVNQKTNNAKVIFFLTSSGRTQYVYLQVGNICSIDKIKVEKRITYLH